ncbi:tetratricopeptide repeat protein [Phytohabitans sp. LJ34]|uniref:tetratricopeptide repeat protein n=1 Tax=Phytohabitans sp. LJ34 TaxID=3452217 RepID=UPI003F88CF09
MDLDEETLLRRERVTGSAQALTLGVGIRYGPRPAGRRRFGTVSGAAGQDSGRGPRGPPHRPSAHARRRSARGDHDEACQLAEDVLARYREVRGADHPFTLAAANDLAIFRMRVGDSAVARKLIEDTAARFVHALGADHPYTLICQMNLANACFAANEITEAYRIAAQEGSRIDSDIEPAET